MQLFWANFFFLVFCSVLLQLSVESDPTIRKTFKMHTSCVCVMRLWMCVCGSEQKNVKRHIILCHTFFCSIRMHSYCSFFLAAFCSSLSPVHCHCQFFFSSLRFRVKSFCRTIKEVTHSTASGINKHVRTWAKWRRWQRHGRWRRRRRCRFYFYISAHDCRFNFYSLLLKLFAVNLFTSHTFPLRSNSLFPLDFIRRFAVRRRHRRRRCCCHQFDRGIISRFTPCIPQFSLLFVSPCVAKIKKKIYSHDILNISRIRFSFYCFFFSACPIVDDFSACYFHFLPVYASLIQTHISSRF